jgi:hypothetical protein
MRPSGYCNFGRQHKHGRFRMRKRRAQLRRINNETHYYLGGSSVRDDGLG